MSTITAPLTLPGDPARGQARLSAAKIARPLAFALLSLAFLVIMALAAAPRSTRGCATGSAPGPWLRLLAMAVILGIGLELLTLPFSFWSGFILEHRHHLSNQTFGAWVWRQVKGYLIGGVFGTGDAAVRLLRVFCNSRSRGGYGQR